MRVTIEHTIDSTTKEFYEFERDGNNVWRYAGIKYSHRNGVGDVWGHKWSKDKGIQSKKKKELDKYAQKYQFSNIEDLEEADCQCCSPFASDIGEIERKYMPTCNKTSDGRIYYHGMSWGYKDASRKKHMPKISEAEIKEKIVKKINKIKIEL